MQLSGPGSVATWEEAERNAARWMEENGFSNVRLSPRGADSGIDVTSDQALAQVKFQAFAVGRPVLQNLFGARGHRTRSLLFFTGSGYSRQAATYADEHQIALFTYSVTGDVRPVNCSARQIVEAAERSKETPDEPQASVPPRNDTAFKKAYKGARDYVYAGYAMLAMAVALPVLCAVVLEAETGLLSAGLFLVMGVGMTILGAYRDGVIRRRDPARPAELRMPEFLRNLGVRD